MEITAGAPKYTPGARGIWSANDAVRDAERALAEQAEASYKRMIQDQQAGGPARKVGASVSGPMIIAAQRELQAAGVNDQPGVVLADAGYWHFQQMDEFAAQGIPVLIHQTPRNAQPPGRDGTAGVSHGCGDYSPATLAGSFTKSATKRSSRYSGRSNTTAGSTGSNEEAEPQRGLPQSGD